MHFLYIPKKNLVLKRDMPDFIFFHLYNYPCVHEEPTKLIRDVALLA
jgi:hypothetical protein